VAPSVQRRKVWLTPTTTVPCSNAAKTRNSLKLVGVSQTPEPISATSGPKFAILWGHMEEILLFNKVFPIVDMCLTCEHIVRQSRAMVPDGEFLATFCVLYFQRAACSTLTSKFQRVSGFGVLPSLYCSDVAHRKLCTMFGRLVRWYIIYTFLGLLFPDGILPGAKCTLHPSLVFSYIGSVLLHGTPAAGVSQSFATWYTEWNYGTFAEGAPYIRLGGHHVGHRPTL